MPNRHQAQNKRATALRKLLMIAAATLIVGACSAGNEAEPGSSNQDTSASLGRAPEKDGVEQIPEDAPPSNSLGNDAKPAPLRPEDPDSGRPADPLAQLTAADLTKADLQGELGCNFSVASGPLLVAQGIVGGTSRAQGVVKFGEAIQLVSAAGGFNGMIKGATFQGGDANVRIKLTGGLAVGGGESPALPATLTYQQGSGDPQSVNGKWTCGP